MALSRNLLTSTLHPTFKIWALSLLIITPGEGFAAPPVIWSQTYGIGVARSVRQTTDGGFIAAGFTGSDGNTQTRLVRTDANGAVVWDRTYDSRGAAYSVLQNPDGGFTSAGFRITSTQDIQLIRTTANGDTIWTKVYSNGGIAHSIRRTPDGGYIFSGRNNATPTQAILVRTDSLGNVIWDQSYDSRSAYSVSLTHDGGFVAAGIKNLPNDGWLVRTDSSGNMQWEKELANAGTEAARSILQTEDLNFAFAGHDSGDLWLVRVDASGDTLWTRRLSYGTDGREIISGPDDGFVIVGDYPAPFLGDLGLFRFNADGDSLWTIRLGGSDDDEGYSVGSTSDGGYIVGGNKDCPAGEGGICSPPHFWLVRIASETTVGLPVIDVSPLANLIQTRPNPFRRTTFIHYVLPKASFTEVRVFSSEGKLVRTLLSQYQEAGPHTISWDGGDLPSGIYNYELIASGRRLTGRAVLIK